ncbi:MAG: hypothetical protein OEU26_35925 [Candidatus Tectomicrobia bacterium]|nr:hypothetical protein [Candidatus Tectomicrobia bacterium]
MKRLVHIALVCVLALTIAGVATAQNTPEPVVRIGDWIEIGDDAWMNIIGTNTIYYRMTSNVDFDKDVQDLAHSRRATSGGCTESSCDAMQWETRLGADFRYKKNLTMRVLLEQQNVMDGNAIDGNATGERSADVHIERAWIDYKFPNTGLRMRVGAWLWRHDPMSWVGDDDPGFHLWYDLGPNLELYAAAIIQQESQRIGLTNDNDNVYYLFRAASKFNSHRVSLNIVAQRDRFCADCEDNETLRQKTDALYITPAWEGQLGIFKFVAQGSLVIGEVKRGPAPGDDLDIFAAAAQVAAEANLGKIRPFFTFLYGSGDDDPFDNDLNGYATLTHKDITLTASTPILSPLANSSIFSGIEGGPTFSRALGLNGQLQSGDNIFNNNVGVNQSYDVEGGYAGTGVFVPVIGVRFFPVKNWEVSGHWSALWAIETSGLEEQLNRRPINQTLGRTANVDNFIYQEFGAMVSWAINKHFDIRIRGIVALPADGAKDIASMADPADCGKGNTETCDGNDPMLVGQVRFRGRF